MPDDTESQVDAPTPADAVPPPSSEPVASPTTPPPLPPPLPAPAPLTPWQKLKRLLTPVIIVLVLCVKLLGKLKFLVMPILKFLPLLLKTGGTMLLSIWFYAMNWGWMFAVGFVLLMLVHECGHLLAAKQVGLKVGVPVFIPFMGAFIALKDAPPNAWTEARVGLGGPLIGTLGAAACEGLFLATGYPLFRALAYTGFMLNLFNLIPFGFLDGGRIVTAVSPWLWAIGLVMMVALLVTHPSFLLFLILLLSLPRLFSMFRRKTDDEARWFEVTPAQRWTMALLYFGLIAFLVIGMRVTHIAPNAS